jgi:hypothetical protein
MRFAPKKIKKIAIIASLETIDQLREIACIYQTNVSSSFCWSAWPPVTSPAGSLADQALG